MSALIAVKLHGEVVLATDSRMMAPKFDHPVTDSRKKVFEIGPGAFFASSGWAYACEWQAAEAEALARDLGTSDIRVLAGALDAISSRRLEELAGALNAIRSFHPDVEAAVSGNTPFHGYALAGMSEGVPGYVVHEFWVVDGRVACRSTEAFNLPKGHDFAAYVTRGHLVDGMMRDAKTWKHGAVRGVEKVIGELARLHVQVGGPVQLVRIDNDGPQWVHECPAQPDASATNLLNSATIASGVVYSGAIYASQVTAVTFTGFTIVGGTWTWDYNDTKVEINNYYDATLSEYVAFTIRKSSATSQRLCVSKTKLYLIDASNKLRAVLDMTTGRMLLYDSDGCTGAYIDADPTVPALRVFKDTSNQVLAAYSGGAMGLWVNGKKVLTEP